MPKYSEQLKATAKSFNADDNSIDILFYTGAEVDRYGFIDGDFQAYKLRFDMDTIKPDRFEKGVGLFMDHDTDMKNQIGHARPQSLKRTDDGYSATFDLEDVSEFPVEHEVRRTVEKIKTKQANEYSMGVGWDDQVTEKIDGQLYLTASKWEPYEISVVGADADNGTESLSHEEGKMPEKTEMQGQAAPDNAAELAAAKLEAVAIDRLRTASIQTLSEKFPGYEKLCNGFVADGTSFDDAREAILAKVEVKLAAKPEPEAAPAHKTSTVSTELGKEAAEKVREGVVEALAYKLGTKVVERPKDNEFLGYSMIEMAEELADARGEKYRRGQLKTAIMDRGNARLGMTPSDFPIIVGEAANVFLLAQGNVEEQEFQRVGTREDLPNMNAVKGVDTVFDVAVTDNIKPGGLYPRAKMSESGETYQLFKKGAFLYLTEEVLDAERVNAFGNGIMQGAAFFRRLESQAFWASLFGTTGVGQEMSDGENFFSAAHSNLSSGVTFAAGEVETLMALLAAQKKGKVTMNLPAFALVVPTALRFSAEKLIYGEFGPTAVANARLPRLRSLDIISDSAIDEITTTGYAVITDPRLITIASYGWKIGEEGVQLKMPTWEDKNDSWAYKFKDRFGSAPMTPAGAAYNPGA